MAISLPTTFTGLGGDDEEQRMTPQGMSTPIPTAVQPSQAPQTLPDAYQEGPAMSNYKTLLAARPVLSDYHPHGLRNILGTAAGVVAGIAGDPNASQIRQDIRYQPYNFQVRQYESNLDKAKEQAQMELNQRQLQRQYGLDIATIQAKQAQAQMYGQHGDYFEHRATEPYLDFDQKLKIAQAEHPGNNTASRIDTQRGAYVYTDPSTGKPTTYQYGQPLPPKPTSLDVANVTTKAANERAAAHEAAENKRNTDRIASQNSRASERDSTRGVAPKDQAAADNLAIDRALRANPAWKKFIDPKGKVIGPQPSGGLFGFGSSVSEDDKKDFERFNSAVKAESTHILKQGKTQSSSTSLSIPSGVKSSDDEEDDPYELTTEDDEDDN